MFRGIAAGMPRAPRLTMRFAVAALLLAAPSIAAAGPFTAGVSIGSHQDKVDQDHEGNRTLGLFGRFAVAKQLAVQLEVQKIETDEATWEPTTIRTGTASLRLDLLQKGRLIPTIAFGAGIDRASTEYDTREGHHYEGGFGLEYRADGGFNIGLDLRFGGRSVDQQEAVVNDVNGGGAPPSTRPLAYDGGGLREGEYRAVRLHASVTF
jgi:hypothetical protein